jgi:hypothetical protein
MRWIVTIDHHGGCIGMGEDADGAPARGTPDQAETLPMDFRLHEPAAMCCSRAVAATLTPIGGMGSSR